MTPAHILQLSFTSDKTYPSYWDLSESTGYISGYEEVQGNPMLKPSTDYSANLNYILKNKYIFSLAYDYQPDLFQQLAYQSTERLALIYKTLNWDYQQSFSATTIIPFKSDIGWTVTSHCKLNTVKQNVTNSSIFPSTTASGSDSPCYKII